MTEEIRNGPMKEVIRATIRVLCFRDVSTFIRLHGTGRVGRGDSMLAFGRRAICRRPFPEMDVVGLVACGALREAGSVCLDAVVGPPGLHFRP